MSKKLLKLMDREAFIKDVDYYTYDEDAEFEGVYIDTQSS